MTGDAGEKVLDERAPDALDREIVQRREIAQAVFGDAHGLRPRPHAAGGADDEPLEPCLRDLAETFRRRPVRGAGLAPALNVELERLRVLVDREGGGAVTARRVAVADLVAPLAPGAERLVREQRAAQRDHGSGAAFRALLVSNPYWR